MKEINISKNIADLRKRKGITQEQLAMALNISPQAISKWETNSSFPDVQTLPLKSIKKNRTKIIILSAIVIVLITLIIWIALSNKALELNTYRIESGDLPEAFDGFRIAQVSDLHNAEMGKDNEKLISMLENAEPDIIVITGDMIDSRNTNIDIALAFAEKAAQIAPCYYVTGNHEARVSEYDELQEGLIQLGVTVLENSKTELVVSGEKITLIGVDDPSFQTDYLFGDDESVMKSKLDELTSEDDGYTILLSHRPELFETYVDSGVDVVFSGHAHGGQFRIPFVGGIVAPNQGLFPQYDSGLYTEGNTNMLVSKGIGNSIIPFRVNNRPEVIIVELSVQGE